MSKQPNWPPCTCEYFPAGLADIHKSCEHAALNQVGISLKPFRFCPWCGGTLSRTPTCTRPKSLNHPCTNESQDGLCSKPDITVARADGIHHCGYLKWKVTRPGGEQ